MNVLIHTATAIGISALVCNTKKRSRKITLSIIAFMLGIILHGVIDYIPHCYPLNSKADVIISLFLIIFLTIRSNHTYKLIVLASFIGSVFPDLVDLSPAIIDKFINVRLNSDVKVFPWHWKEYSGSIYNGSCTVSNINHIIWLFFLFLLYFFKKEDLKTIYNIK